LRELSAFTTDLTRPETGFNCGLRAREMADKRRAAREPFAEIANGVFSWKLRNAGLTQNVVSPLFILMQKTNTKDVFTPYKVANPRIKGRR
jgi:hypothetical protein